MTSGTETPTTIADRIRLDIVDGVFHPRERLVEADLANHYGVNRSAIRAALLQLSSEGLVDRELNKGARVRALTLEQGIEITQVRQQLESLCARLAATRATSEERRQLRTLVDELHDAYAAQDMPRYRRANTSFHMAIIEMARHRTANDILTRLGNLNLSRHFPLAFRSAPATRSEDEHEHIAQAIISGNADEAAAAMSVHLQIMIDVLEEQARIMAGGEQDQRPGELGQAWPMAV